MALLIRNSFLPNVFDDFISSDDIKSNNSWISEPSVNVKEDNDGFGLELAIPGLSKEDIRIDVENNELKISSNKEFNGENNGYLRREFKYGKFEKVFELPKAINTDEISAKVENGILSVHLPKREEAKVKPAREIKIA